MIKKIPIPLFYSIFITLFVLVSMSIISYLLLKTKYNSMQNYILSQSQSIFATLQSSVENQNQVAIQEIITSIGKNNKSKALLESSIIIYPKGYYYSSTRSDLVGNDISSGLLDLLQNHQKTSSVQQINTQNGVQYQNIIPINSFQNGQIWFLKNTFDKSFFNSEFNNFRLLLIFISVLCVLFTFFFVYIACYFLLSQKLTSLNYHITGLLQFKKPTIISHSLKEISLISKKLVKIYKLINEQKNSILELEEELQNPLKAKIEEKSFFNGNYLCILIRLDYDLSSGGKDKINLKEFLLEFFHLIIKNTQEQRVELKYFGNYFFLVLDIKNFFLLGVQAIKDIEKKIHPNTTQFQKFGITGLKCSMAVHFGKIHSMNINEQRMDNNVFYYGSTNYILHNIINKAKAKEVLITQSVIPYLSEKEKYTDINVEINFYGEKYKIYLLGKNDKKISENNTKKIFEEDNNPLSVNAMLEETLRQ